MTNADLLDICRRKGLMLATAESCTGGMVAAALTDIAGASAVFERGFVTYTNAAKVELLGVRQDTLARFGAVSEEVALEMAIGARASSSADLAVSVTGIAGPGGSERKPEGRVCFALASAQGAQAQTREFGAPGRSAVRKAATKHALSMFADAASRFCS